MLPTLPHGLVPEFITPGSSKYAAILHGTHRELLLAADERIKQAKSFLSIGYGFNDSQIQEGILTRIRSGVPLVSITKEVSDSAAHLLANNARNYITIQQGSEPIDIRSGGLDFVITESILQELFSSGRFELCPSLYVFRCSAYDTK